MITYNWIINSLLCKPRVGDLTNVLYSVGWTLRGTNETVVFADQNGSCSLPIPNPESFTPFEDLTEAQVGGFVETAIGLNTVQSLKASIAQHIEDQVNPPLVSMTLPWAEPPVGHTINPVVQ